MAEHESAQAQRRAAELRARLAGNSLEHDQEDIAFWRRASEQERGRTLYSLLQFADNVLSSTPPRPVQPLTFPGFPPRRTPTHVSPPEP